MRVMVIEDQEFTRRLIVGILRDHGVSSLIDLTDGYEALAFLEKASWSTVPHVIVCDVNMDRVNGIDFLRRLRGITNEASAGIPVIFLTGDARSDIVVQAKEAGADAFLLKPVTPVKLIKSIQAVMGARAR